MFTLTKKFYSPDFTKIKVTMKKDKFIVFSETKKKCYEINAVIDRYKLKYDKNNYDCDFDNSELIISGKNELKFLFPDGKIISILHNNPICDIPESSKYYIFSTKGKENYNDLYVEIFEFDGDTYVNFNGRYEKVVGNYVNHYYSAYEALLLLITTDNFHVSNYNYNETVKYDEDNKIIDCKYINFSLYIVCQRSIIKIDNKYDNSFISKKINNLYNFDLNILWVFDLDCPHSNMLDMKCDILSASFANKSILLETDEGIIITKIRNYLDHEEFDDYEMFENIVKPDFNIVAFTIKNIKPEFDYDEVHIYLLSEDLVVYRYDEYNDKLLVESELIDDIEKLFPCKKTIKSANF